MRKGSLFVFVAVAALAMECITVTPEEYGALEVVAYDGWGSVAPVSGARLRDLNTGKVEYSTKSGRFAKVPVGRWALSVDVGGFMPARSHVYVSKGTTRTRVQMEFGGIECADETGILRGKVVGLRGAKDRWLKVSPLYGAGSVDTPIGADGWFHLEKLSWGKYLLVVIEDGQPLRTETVELRRKAEEITITLPGA